MEDQSKDELPPIPPDVLRELEPMLSDGSIKWMRPDHPLRRRIPDAYFILDTNLLDNLVRAGVEVLPAPFKLVDSNQLKLERLEDAYNKLGEHLKMGCLEGESEDAMIQRIIRSMLVNMAECIDDEKTFMDLSRATYRQIHGVPQRGPRTLKKECFWAIDSCLGPDGYGFPPHHWVQRAYEKGISLPKPFNKASRTHNRPTMAELIRMIQSRVSDPKTGKPVPESTARKYARLWEKEEYHKKITMPERWVLHKALSKAKKPKK